MLHALDSPSSFSPSEMPCLGGILDENRNTGNGVDAVLDALLISNSEFISFFSLSL